MRTIFSIPLTGTSPIDHKNSLGMLRFEDGNVYKLCKNGSGGTLSAGDVVFGGSDLTETIVTKAASDYLSAMVGVVVPATVPVDHYFWVQIYGYNAEILTIGHASLLTGDALKGVISQLYVERSTAMGVAPIYGRFIEAKEAYTTTSVAALKKGFIHCF